MSSDEDITAAHWSKNVASSDAFSPQMYWLAVPAVQRRFQRKACAGTGHAWWGAYLMKEFFDRPPSAARMLSIGCGSGGLERDLFRQNAFAQCDAMDIAPGAIEIARAQAQAIGAHNIHYSLQDVQKTPLGHGIYDAVWFNP